MKDHEVAHEEYRREVWIKVAAAVGGAANSTDKATMASWANAALAEFDRKFYAHNLQYDPVVLPSFEEGDG